MSRRDYSGSETIRKLERAAAKRFTEAEYLYTIHKLAAVYLYGYAIEMWVKNATYKLFGFKDTQIIRKDDRDSLSAGATTHGIAIVGQHDFLGWTKFYVSLRGSGARAVTSRPAQSGYDAGLGNQMVAQALRASSIWNPGLRYSPDDMDEPDAREVREPAEWFRGHYLKFTS